MALDLQNGLPATTAPGVRDHRGARQSRGAERRPGPAQGRRTDIQALRAVAVSLVVAYHLRPDLLSGGFVGVDVFFVISGFLITSHLVARPPRTPRDLAEFWGRRIRRLLPAALVVLGSTLLATRLLLPATQWEATARQVRGAALSVVNWQLATDAVDYSASEAAATPVQHFWSLSVEEQFYLGWPILIVAVATIATITHRHVVRLLRLVLIMVAGGSLGYGIWLTATDPSRAYFVTPTRIWELAAGALLAAVSFRAGTAPASSRWWTPARRTIMVWTGLTAVLGSAWCYSSDTPFPGVAALLPVLGCVAVIAGGDPRHRFAPGAALAVRPVQWLGDVSYSVYLWHWPLLIIVGSVAAASGPPDRLGALGAVVVVVATLGLAAVTRTQVEQRFGRPASGSPLRATFAAAVLGTAVVVLLASAQLAEVGRRQQTAESQVARTLERAGGCVGAAALDPGADCPAVAVEALVPDLAAAGRDLYTLDQRYLAEDCWAGAPDFAVRSCAAGRPDGTFSVAVVGNSHAVQWMAAIDTIAERRGWRVATYFAHSCALVDVVQEFETPAQTASCARWVEQTSARVGGGYDLVLLANRHVRRPPGTAVADTGQVYLAGYTSLLRRWSGQGVTAVAITDTPLPPASVGDAPDCLAQRADVDACSGPRSAWVEPDPVRRAAAAVGDPRIRSVNLTDHVCGRDRCAAAVGGVVVYADRQHLTATYAATLTPYLDEELQAALARMR